MSTSDQAVNEEIFLKQKGEQSYDIENLKSSPVNSTCNTPSLRQENKLPQQHSKQHF